MALFTMAFGRTANSRKANAITLMVKFMTESGLMENHTVKASRLGLMDENMMVSGTKVNQLVLVGKYTLMEERKKGIGKTESL
jgi:hypothetical protein